MAINKASNVRLVPKTVWVGQGNLEFSDQQEAHEYFTNNNVRGNNMELEKREKLVVEDIE